MRSAPLRVHGLAAWLLVVGIVIQVFLAGAALVNLGGSGDFSAHSQFGYTAVGILALAVLLTAVAARRPGVDIGATFGMLLLYVLQTALPQFRASIPMIAALHPVNAMLLFGLAVWYAWRATGRGGSGPAGRSPGKTAPHPPPPQSESDSWT